MPTHSQLLTHRESHTCMDTLHPCRKSSGSHGDFGSRLHHFAARQSDVSPVRPQYEPDLFADAHSCASPCESGCARGRGFLGSFAPLGRDLLTAEEAAASQTLVASAARGTLPAAGSPKLLPQTFHTADDDDNHLQRSKHQGINLWFHMEITLTGARWWFWL